MAYRRRSSGRSSYRSSGRASYRGRSGGGRSGRRTARRRSGASSARTVRLVIQTQQAPAAIDPSGYGMKAASAPRKAQF